MPDSIQDKEFGEIAIRRIKTASHIKIGVTPNGTLKATMPPAAPQFLLKRLIKSSREEIRHLLKRSIPQLIYTNDMRIGKSHSLLIKVGPLMSVKRSKYTIVATKPADKEDDDPSLQQAIRLEVIKALRAEAKHYLPRRLEILATQLDYSYERVRLSHASTRWGSCSSSGTISLNIALMKLPFELIDYVIIHELCHTKEMNHSKSFWQLVAAADSNFQEHRKLVKSHTPTI